MNPTRIQRQRTKGWSKPPRCMIVDRTSHFGNPFTIQRLLREPVTHRLVEVTPATTECPRLDRAEAYAQITHRIYKDRRASPQARELLLAVAYALCIAPDDPRRVLNIAARALGRNPATRRPRLDALIADDAPRYEPPREASNWPPNQGPACQAPASARSPTDHGPLPIGPGGEVVIRLGVNAVQPRHPTRA
ncbi:hypothetical protein ACPCVL_28095 [Streptomyces koyangensis]|uniref:hypothetical protein n=1 Tax=Streptomyces koyangensis TaxID=188770 RepID=UPI003C302151